MNKKEVAIISLHGKSTALRTNYSRFYLIIMTACKSDLVNCSKNEWNSGKKHFSEIKRDWGCYILKYRVNKKVSTLRQESHSSHL